MMPGAWTAHTRCRQIHYVPDGRTVSLCGKLRETTRTRVESPDWDETDPRTCQTCKNLKKWVTPKAAAAVKADKAQ
jgi:hypothetical protein